MSWSTYYKFRFLLLHPDLPFLQEPPLSAKESLAGWNAMGSKANQWSCRALASQAEPRWLSRLEPWPLLSGVIILVLIQWLLQMRTHGLVLLQSPSENITEWLPQLGAIHGQVFPQKASPRSWLTAGFGWGQTPTKKSWSTLNSVKLCSLKRAQKWGKAEKKSWVWLWGSVQFSTTNSIPKLGN